VESGYAFGLARPSRNITGFTLVQEGLFGKRLQLLCEAFPQITAVSVLVNPRHGNSNSFFENTEAAARSLGLGDLRRVWAESAAALRALSPTVFSGTGGVVVQPDGIFYNSRRDVVALVHAARLPAIYPEREYADDGGLMAYGANLPDNYRRAADYVDRILKGAKPRDLPWQEPVKFDFVVNLQTAKALGLTIPPPLVDSATEVIG
jgi:putative ABC transport system substrate-binding protein